MTRVTRRNLVVGGVASTAAAVILSACSSSPAAPTAAPQPTQAAASAASGSAPSPTVAPATQATAPSSASAVKLIGLFQANGLKDRQIWLNCFKAFSQEYPNVSVQFVQWAFDASKVLTMMAGGTPPDVFESHPAIIMAFIAANQLTDLTDKAKADTKLDEADILPNQLAFVTYDGKLYALPYYSGPSTIFLNETMFEEAGLTSPSKNWQTKLWTWNDLHTLALKFAKGTGTSKTWGFDQGGHNTSIQYYWCVPIWDNGGFMIDKSGATWGLDQPPALEMLQMHVDLYKHGAIPTATESQSMPSTGAFTTGRLAMSFGVRGDVPEYAANSKFKLGLAPMPQGTANPPWVNRDGPNGVAIPKGVKHPNDSYRLGRFMGSVAGQKIFMAGGRSVPIRKSVLESEDFKKSLLPWEDINIYIKAANTVKVFRLPPKGTEMQRILNTEWDKVLLGQEDAKTAMQNAVPQMNALLKSGGSEH
jgi:multiple sugar transport system substrate-binding protein